MSELNWYSTAVRVFCYIGDDVTDCWEPVHVLRAQDFAQAMQRALELGRSHNETYENKDGELVRWEFVQVLTLDGLGTQLEDGREVWMGRPVSSEADFEPIISQVPPRPEDSEPEHTGV